MRVFIASTGSATVKIPEPELVEGSGLEKRERLYNKTPINAQIGLFHLQALRITWPF